MRALSVGSENCRSRSDCAEFWALPQRSSISLPKRALLAEIICAYFGISIKIALFKSSPINSQLRALYSVIFPTQIVERQLYQQRTEKSGKARGLQSVANLYMPCRCQQRFPFFYSIPVWYTEILQKKVQSIYPQEIHKMGKRGWQSSINRKSNFH